MADELLIEKLIKTVDGIASDVRSNSFKLDLLESMVGNLTSDVKTLSGQFTDVAGMSIRDNQRIDKIETRLDIVEAKAN